MKYVFEKWEEKRDITAPYVRFSAVQMYLPMALLKRVKLVNSATCFDLLVDRLKRVLALRFHPSGKHVLHTEPAQIGVTQFVKTHMPVIGKKIPLKKIDDGKYENTWAGHLDNKELPSVDGQPDCGPDYNRPNSFPAEGSCKKKK